MAAFWRLPHQRSPSLSPLPSASPPIPLLRSFLSPRASSRQPFPTSHYLTRSFCGMRRTPVASSPSRSPLTSTCTDRQVHTRHTDGKERSHHDTGRGIQRWAACRRWWNSEVRPQASATRAAVFRAPGILIGSEEYENGAISVFLRSTRVEYRDPSQSRLDHGCPSGSQMALSSRLPDDSDSQSRRMNLRFLFLGCPERPIRPEMITNTLFRRWFRSSLRFTNMHDCERNSELRSPVRSSSDWGLTEGVRLRRMRPHYGRPRAPLSLASRFSASAEALPGSRCRRIYLPREPFARWGVWNCAEGNESSWADLMVEC